MEGNDVTRLILSDEDTELIDPPSRSPSTMKQRFEQDFLPNGKIDKIKVETNETKPRETYAFGNTRHETSENLFKNKYIDVDRHDRTNITMDLNKTGNSSTPFSEGKFQFIPKLPVLLHTKDFNSSTKPLFTISLLNNPKFRKIRLEHDQLRKLWAKRN